LVLADPYKKTDAQSLEFTVRIPPEGARPCAAQFIAPPPTFEVQHIVPPEELEAYQEAQQVKGQD
jgi:hypothetical protein